jgi:hypothetical protein
MTEQEKTLEETVESDWMKSVRKAAKKSCDGNQHTYRYHHMLNQFIKGAKWQQQQTSEREIIEKFVEYLYNVTGKFYKEEADDYLKEKEDK